VQEPNTSRRGAGVLISLAVAIFLLHAAVLALEQRFNAGTLYSNLAQLTSALLAVSACVFASRRRQGFPRHFWWFVAAGFGIWSLAQTIATYYDSILHRSTNQPWPSDILFFVAMVPALMTLFIDQEKGFQWRQWPRIFDLSQLIILAIAGYLFTFQNPAAWKEGWGPVGQYSWAPDTARDAAFFVVFLVSALRSKHKAARALYRFFAIFLFVYLAGELPYLYLQSLYKLQTGTYWDFAWSVPFLVATVLAATMKPEGIRDGSREEQPAAREQRWGQWGLVHIASLAFPLLVLLMAAGLAEKQLITVSLLVFLSFACSVARILFAEHEHMQATKALEESHALLNSIFEGTGDGIFIRDLEGRYVIVNETFAEMMNLKREQIIGRSAAEVFSAEDAKAVAEEDSVVLESGRSHTFQSRMSASGRNQVFLVTKAPWRDATGKIVGLLGALRDITEYSQMEERLRQSQKMEAIGTLAGGVAHDFNNLLMVISGYSSVLADSLAGEPNLRSHVDQIHKASERAASLTRQLLTFSRKQTIQPAVLNLNHVITGMEKLLHRLIGENILVSTQLAPDLGAVLADAGQMEQVILNLAVNARDAMPKGGQLTFESRNVDFGDSIASADSMKPGRYVECVVRDTGVGMDLNVQTRLFEPFFTTKPAGKGTGLGLSTVYGILKQSNGHITFTSQPGHGSTFRIYLPRVDFPQLAVSSSGKTEAELAGRETVLLVEDDPSVSALISAVLGSHGYTVLCPDRPQEAEKLFDARGGRVDLLLSDVVMPEVSGTELAKRLTAKNPRIKVLFVSGYVGDSLVRQGIQDREVNFLQKPFAPLTLARKVREVLDGSRVSGN
jgi:PAS domain S-box-containing protein